MFQSSWHKKLTIISSSFQSAAKLGALFLSTGKLRISECKKRQKEKNYFWKDRKAWGWKNGNRAPFSCSTLAWKIPWMEEPGRLQSMGSLRVRHDWATSLSLFTFMHWKREWQPTSVFLPGEPQEWGSWWAAVYGVAQSWTRLKRLSSSSSRILLSFYYNDLYRFKINKVTKNCKHLLFGKISNNWLKI